jgi:propanediol dehydratase small subunit
MTELSPAAQTVLDAYDNSPFDEDCGDRVAIAAALRAAADQVVPWEMWLGTDETCYAYYRQRRNTRRQLLAIADELEQLVNN